jgi:hypothetical protein
MRSDVLIVLIRRRKLSRSLSRMRMMQRVSTWEPEDLPSKFRFIRLRRDRFDPGELDGDRCIDILSTVKSGNLICAPIHDVTSSICAHDCA